MDQELIEIFIEEIGELKEKLIPICENMRSNHQQPTLFADFSQIVDRIYGTATTMGFDDVGAYLGAVKNISRQASTANIPRGMQEVFKIIRTCMDNFEVMQKSLSNAQAANEMRAKLALEIKKIEKIEKEIFSFSQNAKTNIF